MNPYYVSFYEYLKMLALSDDIINGIIQCYSVKHYKKGQYFTSINEISDKIGFVVNGLFFMHTIQQDGTIFTKEFIKNGHFLLATFDTEKESTVHIQALKNSIILEARYSEIQKLYQRHPDVEALSKKRMEFEIESIYQRMACYATVTAKDRYLLFKKEYSTTVEEIPQYIIASYLGITPTQLSRIKSQINS